MIINYYLRMQLKQSQNDRQENDDEDDDMTIATDKKKILLESIVNI